LARFSLWEIMAIGEVKLRWVEKPPKRREVRIPGISFY
jgi:hypothetical protein